jgi:sugar phosphate permease
MESKSTKVSTGNESLAVEATTSVQSPRAAIQFQKPTRVRVWLVTILFITLFVAYLDRVNISVLIANPQFLRDMGLTRNPVGQGLLMTFFLIAYGIGNVLLSPTGDRFGPRKTMCIALVAWTVPVVMAATAKTLVVLYVSRFLLGLGEAMHYPMLVAFVKNWFPIQERGRANSAWILGQMLGIAVAMPIFSMIVVGCGWRAIFWVCAVCGAALIPIVWFFTADRPEQSRWTNQAEVEYIAKGQKIETERQEKGIQPSTAWRNAIVLMTDLNFCCSAVSYYASVTAWWGLVTWLPQYLRIARGFSWAQMGVFASLPFVVGTIAIIIAGFLADRFKRSAPLIGIGLAGTALFILMGAFVHNAYLSACLISVAMFFKGLMQPMSWSVVQAIASAKMVGQATGLQNGSAQIIGSMSPVIMGFLISITGTYTAGLMYLVGFGYSGEGER